MFPSDLESCRVEGRVAVSMGPPERRVGHNDSAGQFPRSRTGDEQCLMDPPLSLEDHRDPAGQRVVDHVEPAREIEPPFGVRDHPDVVHHDASPPLEPDAPPRTDGRRRRRPSRGSSEQCGPEPPNLLVLHHRGPPPGPGAPNAKPWVERMEPDHQLVPASNDRMVVADTSISVTRHAGRSRRPIRPKRASPIAMPYHRSARESSTERK